MTAGTFPGSAAGLWWPPCGVGDFADVAWILAGHLGNAPGVSGLQVYRYEDRLYATVTADNRELVELLGSRPGWEQWSTARGRAWANGDVGGIRVRVTWISPEYMAAVRASTAQAPVRVETAGSFG